MRSLLFSQARAFNNLHVPRIYNSLNFVDLLGFGPDLNLIMDPRNGRNGAWGWRSRERCRATPVALLSQVKTPQRTPSLAAPLP